MYIRLSDGEDYCADCTIRYWERDGCCPYLEWAKVCTAFLDGAAMTLIIL